MQLELQLLIDFRWHFGKTIFHSDLNGILMGAESELELEISPPYRVKVYRFIFWEAAEEKLMICKKKNQQHQQWYYILFLMAGESRQCNKLQQ